MVKPGGEVTVSNAEVPILSVTAVIVVVPAVTPVATPLASTVATAGLLLVNVTEPVLIGLPYWSFAEVVNCCFSPACIDALLGVKASESRIDGAGFGFEADVEPPPQPAIEQTMRMTILSDIRVRLSRSKWLRSPDKQLSFRVNCSVEESWGILSRVFPPSLQTVFSCVRFIRVGPIPGG
jgi:hypothetical protein